MKKGYKVIDIDTHTHVNPSYDGWSKPYRMFQKSLLLGEKVRPALRLPKG
jgi:hypothetical protein